MRNRQAVFEEFKIEGNSVTHVPLNATFYAYEGREEIHACHVGHLGSVLPNGDDYDEDSVWKVARQLMKDRLRVSKWECPLCGQTVTLVKGGAPRLPPEYFSECKLSERLLGIECIAFRQQSKARELLAEKIGG